MIAIIQKTWCMSYHILTCILQMRWYSFITISAKSFSQKSRERDVKFALNFYCSLSELD